MSPAKYTQEERQVLYREAVEGFKFVLDHPDMSDPDDNSVGGSLLCSGDMVTLSDVMGVEEEDEDRGRPLLPSRGYELVSLC